MTGGGGRRPGPPRDSSHGGGVMTLAFVAVVVGGAEAGMVEVEEDLSKLANGMPLFVFSPPFFASLPSPFFTHVRPWRMVACFCLQV